MDYDNLYCLVNADEAEEGTYGYFANTVGDLKTAIERKKTTLKVVYERLDHVLDDGYERRFMTRVGTFSLFYRTDRDFNKMRY